jgi:two-component system sensor histidine kinase RstB
MMTRLFIRFYLGVILILFGAWALQACSFRFFSPPENKNVFDDMFGGGVRLARKLYLGSRDSDATLQAVQRHFAYPVDVVSLSAIPDDARHRLTSGNDVVVYADNGFFSATLLPNGDRALRFGPMPAPRGPSERKLLISLGVLLALVAGAIALLLRPVSRQLRMLESTATAIAGGDFGARVDERRVTSARMLARAMNEMAGRTESLLRTQREMLQAVSHELRTPLTRIGFAIDLLRSEKDQQQREIRLNSLESAALELDNLVGELLHYVRWESKRPHVDDEEIELLPLVENVIDQYAAMQPSKRFSIGENLKRGDGVIRGDARALERAIGNLVSNASRFAKSRIVIDSRASSGGMIIEVDDDGPGIPLADRERVFEPFVRLDDSGRGAGLGLTLVRRIVSHYGGTVSVLDGPSGSCRMRVSLPTARLGSKLQAS